MFRTPPEGDWFVFEGDDGIPLACRLSQVQWISFPDSRKVDKNPAQIDFINGKSWCVSKNVALKMAEAIKLKALS